MNDVKETILAEHANAIRQLGKRYMADASEIGRILTEAKKIAGRGNWLWWLEREFGWKERTAQNFMRVHKIAIKNAKFADLTLPVSGLYLLAAPSTPEEARTEVIERAEKGEAMTVAKVQDVVARKKTPKPAKAPESGGTAHEPDPWLDAALAKPTPAAMAEDVIAALRTDIAELIANCAERLGERFWAVLIDDVREAVEMQADGLRKRAKNDSCRAGIKLRDHKSGAGPWPTASSLI